MHTIWSILSSQDEYWQTDPSRKICTSDRKLNPSAWTLFNVPASWRLRSETGPRPMAIQIWPGIHKSKAQGETAPRRAQGRPCFRGVEWGRVAIHSGPVLRPFWGSAPAACKLSLSRSHRRRRSSPGSVLKPPSLSRAGPWSSPGRAAGTSTTRREEGGRLTDGGACEREGWFVRGGGGGAGVDDWGRRDRYRSRPGPTRPPQAPPTVRAGLPRHSPLRPHVSSSWPRPGSNSCSTSFHQPPPPSPEVRFIGKHCVGVVTPVCSMKGQNRSPRVFWFRYTYVDGFIVQKKKGFFLPSWSIKETTFPCPHGW